MKATRVNTAGGIKMEFLTVKLDPAEKHTIYRMSVKCESRSRNLEIIIYDVALVTQKRNGTDIFLSAWCFFCGGQIKQLEAELPQNSEINMENLETLFALIRKSKISENIHKYQLCCKKKENTLGA